MIRLSQLKPAYFIPVALIIAIGLVIALLGPKTQEVSGDDAKTRVTDGRHYYIFIRSLEVAPKKPSGKPWDRGDEAPDLFYEVHWRDNEVFASSTQRNQLIGNWSPLGVDTMNAIREGRIGIDSVIHAAAIRASQSETFELRIYDSDAVSRDSIAMLSFSFSELKEGDNVFSYEQREDNSVTHLRLAVVDADLPLVGQLEQIMNPSS